ncbi:PPOX class F420-dependent oxidoreductase [Micromonospora sp. NBRC 101691]|uniref:PPOX class F420-dependent oxidoreductase n=1 Tax=Micromonospora sp. NBRC 101691 TaxID=3032198 RepID=UPI0024A38227|nr:PPOX class F420-dependent oxidoreductase [Micromonospora sp. NBRC 101691]GLY26328.1 PPOX class F420-dependent enzyme [Micromonospora sp. NBRC 101691]
MAFLTADDIALLNESQLAHVATIEADGTPHVTPVWVDTDGEHVIFNTAKGRVKHRNMERNPVVAISVSDRTNDYRTLWIKGTVELTTEGADEHIDRMAKKYLDKDTYPFRKPGEERVIVKVTPTQRLSQG